MIAPRTEPYERHYRIRLPPWMIGEECCYSHTAQSVEHSIHPRTVSGWCWVERCSPWPAPFSPQSPPKIALLCSLSKFRNDTALRKHLHRVFVSLGVRYAKYKTELERIEGLRKSLQFYGNKGSRDTLIELRLAENCMALDVRIFGVLEGVGVKVSPDDIFRYVEEELIRKVARPLGITGGQLDRILFKNYNELLQDLKAKKI